MSHLGITKTVARARKILYWPGMTSQIEAHIAKCAICEKYSCNKIKEPLIPYSMPSLPYQKVEMDLFDLGGKVFLVLVDYLSN